MMIKLLNGIAKVLEWIWFPIGRNGMFLPFMYVLGIVVGSLEVPDWKGAHIYGNIWYELFTDLYAICIILAFFPKGIRRWCHHLIYIIAYALALIDVFCWVRFSSAISPSILLLVSETTGSEASEFVNTYITPELFVTDFVWIPIVLLCHVIVTTLPKHRKVKVLAGKIPHIGKQKQRLIHAFLGILTLTCIVSGWEATLTNKECIIRFFHCKTVGDVEKDMNKKPHAEMYQPFYRLAYSIFSNSLVAKQLERLNDNAEKTERMTLSELGIDTCQIRSGDVVVIIGESYNKHHSQLYGYNLPTTPRQKELEKRGRLVKYSDAITPWNLTSFVFKHLMTTYCVGDEGDWCDYPLFCQLLRKAGYQVNFLTNQFLPHAKDAIYDFSGGFFLNDEMLSKVQFDVRNEATHLWDEDLLKDYDRLVASDTLRNASPKAGRKREFTIYHLMGQHVNYRIRCPKKKMKFFTSDYNLPQNKPKEVKNIAYYDCATWYNDSVIGAIVDTYKDRETVILFFSDHGEEVYGPGSLHHCGRNHTTNITENIAQQEYEIPMWIYCSEKYAKKHPDIVQAIRASKDRPFMIDALSHVILGLTGVKSKYYRQEMDLLHPEYDSSRKRLMQHAVEYAPAWKKGN